jgi:hypothetical protein
MSKIWLTWLQPSLGVLGTALVLSNPLCSSAAPNSGTTASTKVPAPYPSWSGLKSTGTNIDRLGGALRVQQLLKGIPTSPDQAVRQLAIDTMATSGKQPSVASVKRPQNFDPLASFTGAPVRFQQLSAKAKKPVQIKQSIAAALKPTTQAKTKVVVPGLAIGTADVRVSSQVLPTIKPTAAVVTARVSTPVQLAAVGSDKTVATPFPVVRPELMQKLEANPVVASVGDVKTASRDLRSIGLPKVIDTISINPVASIPNGLQQLLGNNLDGSIKVSVVPVSKATGPNFRSMSALTKLVSPSELVAPASVTTASLRLATAQSYTNVIKFSIPGETIVASKPTTAANTVTAQVQKSLTTATSGRKSNYVSLVTERGSISAIGQSWISVSQTSNLGGLILGSQQLATLPKVIGLLPTNTVKLSSFTGSTVSDLGNIN